MKIKFGLIWILFCIVFICGCETTKGIASGVAGMAAGLGKGISATATGATKDTKDIWASLDKIDHWMKENLW